MRPVALDKLFTYIRKNEMTKLLHPTVLLAASVVAGCSHVPPAPEKPTQTSASPSTPVVAAQTTGSEEDIWSDSYWRLPAAAGTTEELLPPAMKAEFVNAKKKNFTAKDFKNGKIIRCGQLFYGESNRFAADYGAREQVPYSMRLDCNSNKQIDADDGVHVVTFTGLAPQQKGHFTRWRQAAAQQHGSSGVPYVCFQAEQGKSADPCSIDAHITIDKANFTSKVDGVLKRLNQ